MRGRKRERMKRMDEECLLERETGRSREAEGGRGRGREGGRESVCERERK